MISVNNYPAPPLCEKEILRYAGGGNDEVRAVLAECLREAAGKFIYKVCRITVPVTVQSETVHMGQLSVPSSDLAKNLSGCENAVIFAATVGFFTDRAVAKYGVVSPLKALLFQAIGAERIEALCDAVNSEYRGKPRFSPGYGDLPLSFQRDIFSLLQCEKHIGLTLNDNLIMSPSKSVTAIIGLI